MAILSENNKEIDRALRDRLCSTLHFDPVSGVFTRKANPKYNSQIGQAVGYITNNGYIFISVNGKQYLAHRLAILYCDGYMPVCVDHINGNKLDNRRINLRPCTRQQNTFNMALGPKNKSGVKGVCWSKQKRKWEAKIRANGTRYHLGFFRDLADAEKAVKSARERLHGQFANHGYHKLSDHSSFEVVHGNSC